MSRSVKVTAILAVAAGVSLAQTQPPPDLTLTQAQCRDHNGAQKVCRLGDTLYVAFGNLQDWTKAAPGTNKPQSLVLVLNDRVLKGLTARGPNSDYKELAFDLTRLGTDDPDGKDNRAAWDAILAKGSQNVSVGVALGGAAPFFGGLKVWLQVFPSYTWLIVSFQVILIVGFLILAVRSDIVRDAPSSGGTKMSYSLARCQMAFWFFIIIASFSYIWAVTGDHDSVTPGALILMGISGATGLSSMVVDSSKRSQRQSLETEEKELQERLGEIAPALATVPTPANAGDLKTEQQQKQARLDQVQTSLNNLPSAPDVSDGFLQDILRDETGVSFHRFQMAAWTIVLGFVFVVNVIGSLAMPDFSATLLGLMGISSGTYIGFKIPDPPK